VAPADSPTIDLSYGTEGDEANPLVEYSVPAGIKLAAPDVGLDGVTVTGPSPGVAVAVTTGEAELTDLAIAPAGSVVEATGDPALDTRLAVIALGDADLRLQHSDVSAGIEITGGASAVVDLNTFAQGGVGSDASGSLEVRGNVLDEGWIHAGADQAVVEDNELHNGYIALFGTGHSTVRGNKVDGLRYDVGPGVAITLSEGTEAEVVDNTVTDSATGIKTLFYFGSATIEGNELTSNSVGISVGGYDIVVSGNTVTDGDVIGVEVFNAGPTIENNTITGNTAGLHLGSAQGVSLTGNMICENGTNVRVVSGDMPDLTGNDVCPDDPAG
jgi:parallel beta-helix repeat protein